LCVTNTSNIGCRGHKRATEGVHFARSNAVTGRGLASAAMLAITAAIVIAIVA
jgi:hypothetical protein